MTTSSKIVLEQGSIIVGRWKGGRYMIQRMLGQGANGVVYLVKQMDNARLYALKMGFDTVDIQSEVNVLKALQRQNRRHNTAGRDLSYLVEVDDFTIQGREIPFYVMRYIKGLPLRSFVAKRGKQWFSIAGLHLLRQLQQLHETGWVFGDLKPENVLVSPYGEVELIDYGGVTAIGRSVKQFTEWYDRGFWRAGSRTAEPSYDLFSFAAVCIHLLAKEPLKRVATQLPQTRNSADLLMIIRTEPALKPYRAWLERAISSGFSDTAEAYQLWKDLIQMPSRRGKSQAPTTPRWMLGAFALALTLLGCALYVTLAL